MSEQRDDDGTDSYYQVLRIRAEERDDIRAALKDSREDLARLLAKLSAERDSLGDCPLWDSLDFEDWWQVVLTERVREEYRNTADQVITFMKGRI